MMPPTRPIQPQPESVKSRLLTTIMETLVADLPPADQEFSAEARERWVKRWHSGIDVVYGPVELARSQEVVFGGPVGGGMTAAATVPPTPRDRHTAPPSKRFYVSRSGDVMCEGTQVKFSDLSPGTVIWDERTAPDRGYDPSAEPQWGRTDNIMWADVGTRRDGALPPGVTMRSAAPTTGGDGDDYQAAMT